ncbi:MAG TPA: flagellar biosynthesis anti-sigma factor FlgM [Polyangia bacterium]|jgi:anti-sigma28 factor (negative regulator of flagellin synthesis)
MKTNEVNGTSAPIVQGGQPADRKSAEVVGQAAVGDRATLEQSDQLRASMSNNVNVAASERAVRIHSLTQQVRAGTYRPNSSQLAEQILAEAQFDARLAATLG